jgi:hypothetical protein
MTCTKLEGLPQTIGQSFLRGPPMYMYKAERGSPYLRMRAWVFSDMLYLSPWPSPQATRSSPNASRIFSTMHLQSRVAICWILTFLSFLISILVLCAGTKPNFLPDASIVFVNHPSRSPDSITNHTADCRPSKRARPECFSTSLWRRHRQSSRR